MERVGSHSKKLPCPAFENGSSGQSNQLWNDYVMHLEGQEGLITAAAAHFNSDIEILNCFEFPNGKIET